MELLRVKPNKKAAFQNLKNMLIILHPFLPFVTDHLFSTIFEEELLDYENPKLKFSKSSEIETVQNIIKITTILRKYREVKKISKKNVLEYDININKTPFLENAIAQLANAKIVPNNDALFIDGKLNVRIKESEEVKENYLKELNEKIAKVKFEIDRAEKILSNESFILKAPEEKVKLEQEKLIKYHKELQDYLEEASK
ncbi:UNVERIFIED_CONTAM: class I tRNA ligase family protein [Campylobacter lari]